MNANTSLRQAADPDDEVGHVKAVYAMAKALIEVAGPVWCWDDRPGDVVLRALQTHAREAGLTFGRRRLP